MPTLRLMQASSSRAKLRTSFLMKLCKRHSEGRPRGQLDASDIGN